MTVVKLAKLHATGNDFLVHQASTPLGSRIGAALCDRHRGIGADGLITLGPGRNGADCSMTLHNADGGEAELSGNGLRCLAYVAARSGLGTHDTLVVETAAGRRVIHLERDPHGRVTDADVDMGAVTFDPRAIGLATDKAQDLEATFHGVTYRGDAVGAGNPHFVLFVDDPDDARVAQHGPRLERDDRFPNRTNVEFVRVDTRDRIRMRVWERGAGETLSCGTGACAAAAAAHRRGLVDDDVTVVVPGGELRLRIGETVSLAGPVTHVFDVEIDLDALATA
ncbi:MAG TPA: diaminopimelate epimerase [Acidimicrobiia bacterium]|nr:diaminopimelate epimerase [Acidimicrobiia bacterium]